MLGLILPTKIKKVTGNSRKYNNEIMDALFLSLTNDISHWLVPVLFVYVFYAYCKSIIY